MWTDQNLQCGITPQTIDDLFVYFAAFYGQLWQRGLPTNEKDWKKVKTVWYDALSVFANGDIARTVKSMQEGRSFSQYPPTPGSFVNVCRNQKNSVKSFSFPLRGIETSSREVASRYLKILRKIAFK